jgi:hypothetical protein
MPAQTGQERPPRKQHPLSGISFAASTGRSLLATRTAQNRGVHAFLIFPRKGRRIGSARELGPTHLGLSAKGGHIMPLKQGDLELLEHPVAKELMQSKIPARLAYVWTDGTPRVVPIWFHWDGHEFVLGTPPKAPKLKALPQNPKVALTIDDNNFPHKVLLAEVRHGMVEKPANPFRISLGDSGVYTTFAIELKTLR